MRWKQYLGLSLLAHTVEGRDYYSLSTVLDLVPTLIPTNEPSAKRGGPVAILPQPQWVLRSPVSGAVVGNKRGRDKEVSGSILDDRNGLDKTNSSNCLE